MSTEISMILDDLARRFGVVIDWSNENALPYAQELMMKYIKYRSYNATMWIVIGIFACLVSTFFSVRSYKSAHPEEDDEYYDEDSVVGNMFGAAVFGIPGIAIICCQVHTIIICNTFPEMLIMEYMKGLMK